MLPKKPNPLFVNIGLAGLCIALMLANLIVSVNPEKRNPVILDGMQHSDAAFTQTKAATGGRTMEVEGTVRFGETPYRYGSGPVEAAKAGRELSNPFSWKDAQAVERGKLVYDRFCMTCHVEYKGDKEREVVIRGVPAGGYPLISKRVAGYADGYIFNYVTKGGALMPAYGPQLTEDDRWKLVAYMRSRLNKEKASLK